MAVDHGRLIANAVLWALGKIPQVTIEGKGVIDLALHECADGLALTLFNLTNPMMLKGPVRDNYPLGAQKLSFEIPPGKSVASVRLIVADCSAQFVVEEGRLVVNVPGIDRLEVVHISWG
jgi:hypothetical protein